MKRLSVRDRVMTSHGACISETSRVLTSLQWLKMEALIPAPAERSAICDKVFEEQAAVLSCCTITLHHSRLDVHQEFSWEVFNHPPYCPDLVPSDFHIFLRLKKFLYGQRQRFQNDREANLVALIPAPADYEVRSMIEFFNAQSIAPIKIHSQLCQVYDHTRPDSQHIFRSSAGRCLIIHPIAWTSRPVIFIFSYTSRNSCPVSVSVLRMTETEMSVTEWFQSQAVDFYGTGYKSWSHGITNVLILLF